MVHVTAGTTLGKGSQPLTTPSSCQRSTRASLPMAKRSGVAARSSGVSSASPLSASTMALTSSPASGDAGSKPAASAVSACSATTVANPFAGSGLTVYLVCRRAACSSVISRTLW